MVKNKMEAGDFVITITNEADSWASGWHVAPLHVTALVRHSNGDIEEGLSVTFGITGATGTFADGGIAYTDSDGIATSSVTIDESEGTDISDAAITVTVGEQTVSAPLHIRPTSLRAPFFPLASDGVIDETDVAGGVYGQVQIINGEVGDIVCMYFDDTKIEHTISESSENIQFKIIETLLSTGNHKVAYYHRDFVGNISFSSEASIYVQRDNSSGILDLPKPSVPVADIDGNINQSDLENKDILVVIDGIYGAAGDPVYTMAAPGKCVMYWKSFDKQGNPVEAATFQMSKPITTELTEAPFFVIEKDSIKTLGEGTVSVSYELTIIDDMLLHSSHPNTFIVDVIPPGSRK